MDEKAEELAAAIADGLDDEIRLLRRVHPSWHGQDGRADSGNFKLDPDGDGTSMTVWLDEDDYKAATEGHDGFGVVSVSVAALKAEGLKIMHDPLADNPRHVLVTGKRNDKAMRRIRDKSSWVRYPEKYKLATPPDLPDPSEWKCDLKSD